MSVFPADKVWWPTAKAMPTRISTAAGPFTATPRGWVLHVVVGNGSPWRTFDGSVSPNRRFSHLWVSKKGDVEQYAALDHKAWAQGDGNADWWSVETEGFPTEPLTMVQIRMLAEFHNWVNAPDVLAESPAGQGIGTHFMGGAAWGGHSCPDPAGMEGKGYRSRQRADVITTAKALRGGASTNKGSNPVALTNDEIKRIWTEGFMVDGRQVTGTDLAMQAIWGAQWRETVAGKDVPVTAATRLARAAAPHITPEQVADAVRSVLPAGSTDAHAFIDELVRKLTS